jgi:Uma2 family endonuclease
MPETNQPTELWDGELIMSPSPSYFHQEIVIRFHDALRAWVRSRGLGKTGVAPLDTILTSRRVVQPDVFFVSNEHQDVLTDRIRGVPDLVAEVLSPDSRRRDRLDKRDLYEQHGVREYWLIDPEAETVEVLHLEGGEYTLVGRWRPGDSAESRLLPGFRVDVAALFAPE